MILKNIDFGPVFSSSGTRNFFGEGYWYHKLLKPFGLDFSKSTLITKTTTISPREGNLPLNETNPKELFPSCIKINLRKGAALNAVGLSGPGLFYLLSTHRWQNLPKPFLISFMAVGSSLEERITENKSFVSILKSFLPFKSKFGIQINFSCPNTNHNPNDLINDIFTSLSIFQELNIPIIIKINALFPIKTILKIQNHCDAVSVSNTIPWKDIPNNLKKNLFGSETSPLAKYGGGGLSGKPLLEMTTGWIVVARESGLSLPIIGGGGILSKTDAKKMFQSGADAVELGSIAFLRPWRVKNLIDYIQSNY